MRSVFGLLSVCALGVVPLVGCGENNGGGGSGGSGGTGGTGGNGVACQDNVCPCTEAGIRAAIAEGGGPFTFDCVGPQTVVTEAEIVIDNDVILDGEGNLTVDGNEDHRVFSVSEEAKVELTDFTVTGGYTVDDGPIEERGGGIFNTGTLTVTNSTVSGNTGARSGFGIVNTGTLTVTNSTVSGNTGPVFGYGIENTGTLTVTNSTVSGNTGAESGFGIHNTGTLTVTNSTVSGNTGANSGNGIVNLMGTLTVTNGTVSGNTGPIGYGILDLMGTLTVTNSTVSGNGRGVVTCGGTLTMANSTVSENGVALDLGLERTCSETTSAITSIVIDGECVHDVVTTSTGYNIESPGNTCGFDQPTDLPGVTAEQLNLGPLQDNGGPTLTHSLLPGSVAIDAIPEVDCVNAEGEPLTTDQRGVARPQGPACDVGAFELEVAP